MTIKIQIAYAPVAGAHIIDLSISTAVTIEQAIQQSGILEKFPNIDLRQNRVGIYGKLAELTDPVRDGDRIEIYEPVLVDPKQARRERAKKKNPA